jgi:hypothetical protein
MKNIFFVGLLILIFSGLAFAGAGDYNNQSKQVTVYLSKGWNLVPMGIYDYGNSLSAIFSYSPLNKSYMGAILENGDATRISKYYPNEQAVNSYYNSEVNSLWSSSAWVYARNLYTAKKSYQFFSGKGDEFINNYQLKKGWNFLDMTPPMIGKTFKTLFQNCQLTGLNSWDAVTQSWANSSSSSAATTMLEVTTPLSNYSVGNTFVARVSSDCNLWSGNLTITPPALPQDTSNSYYANDTTAKASWKMGEPLGITDWALGNSGLTIVVINNFMSDIYLNQISIQDVSLQVGESIPASSTLTKTIPITTLCSNGNSIYSVPKSTIIFNYNSSGINNKLQMGIANLSGACPS